MDTDNEPSPTPNTQAMGRHRGRRSVQPLLVMLLSSAALWGCASGRGQDGPAQAAPSLAGTLAQARAQLPGTAAAADTPAAPAPAPGLPEATPSWAPEARAFQVFGDPLLLALVQQALQANTDLATAQAQLAQAQALRDQQAAAQGLQLDASASARRQRSQNQWSHPLAATLDASWELDLFGRLREGVAAAQAQAEASAATLAAARLSVAANTAIAYLQWQGTRAQQQLAQATVAARQQSWQLVQWRVQAGLASPLDEAQARTSWLQAQASLPSLAGSLQQSEHQLAVLLGQAPGSLQARLLASPAHTAVASAQDWPDSVPADLLRRRPDVQAAEQAVVAQWATLAQRRAEGRPRFSISGSLGLQAASWAALGQPAAVLATLGAAVQWPLLDGGAQAAQVAAQQAVLQQAQASYRASMLAALQDLGDAITGLQAQQDQFSALQAADASAQTALALARHRYASGLVDHPTLLDSERSALATADSLTQARTQLATAQVRLLKSLGGGLHRDNTLFLADSATTPLAATRGATAP